MQSTPAPSTSVDPTPVTPLELIRWFSSQIEARALEAYWSTGRMSTVQEMLAACAESLKKAGAGKPLSRVGESPCPWQRCPDGACKPDCNA